MNIKIKSRNFATVIRELYERENYLNTEHEKCGIPQQRREYVAKIRECAEIRENLITLLNKSGITVYPLYANNARSVYKFQIIDIWHGKDTEEYNVQTYN